jgi:nucleoside-diphosphate-sugar epimerase
VRVFLAGASGVIGAPLVPQLLKAGHEVTAMTRSAVRAAQLDAVGAHPLVRGRRSFAHVGPTYGAHVCSIRPIGCTTRA